MRTGAPVPPGATGPSRSGLRVLVVCTANVCRSVLAAHLLDEGLSRWGLDVRSAGLDVAAPLPPCHEVAARVLEHSRGPGGGRVPLLESSRQVSTQDIPASSLVLTMTTRQRGAVVRSHPDARMRTFTLLEAVLLSREVPARAPGVADLASWVQALDRMRSRTPLPPAPTRGRFPLVRRRPDATPPLDIADGHTSPRRSEHLHTLEIVEEASLALARSIDTVLAHPRPAPEAR